MHAQEQTDQIQMQQKPKIATSRITKMHGGISLASQPIDENIEYQSQPNDLHQQQSRESLHDSG
jgi:hypothetical protein